MTNGSGDRLIQQRRHSEAQFVLNLIIILIFLNICFLDLSHGKEDSVINLEFKIGLLVKNF